MLKKFVQIVVVAWAIACIAVFGYWQYTERIANPRVERELTNNPSGERAARVLMLALPSGRRIPVNYLREQEVVYVAADGGWWSEITGTARPVTLLVRGETLSGRARAILDDPERTADVFTRLRPDALEGFGTLVEIRLRPSPGITH